MELYNDGESLPRAAEAFMVCILAHNIGRVNAATTCQQTLPPTIKAYSCVFFVFFFYGKFVVYEKDTTGCISS